MTIGVEPLRRWVLWLFLAVSAFAAIEPSPYEAMFFIALPVFAAGGLRFDRAMTPLIVSLGIYDAGGLLALTPFVDESESVTFIAITIYISLTTLFFAGVVAAAPRERMETIRAGYVVAGLIAAALGIMGYFDVAGTGDYFTLYDNSRAMGPFKDPNVFGPFLVPPIVWLCQDLVLGRGRPMAAAAKLAVLLLGLLLSFSRGAIIDFVASGALLLGLTYLTATSSRQRARTVAIAAILTLLVVLLVAAALSVPEIRQLALERTSLAEDYDSGPQGRFGNQARSIPMLLELPFGFGPLRFGHIFPQDPHEVFISAFASFGWIGGLAFIGFIAATLYFGWRLSFRRSPLQPQVVALWSALLPQLVQGVQIDTGHWRHLFLMCGCLYGLAAAERLERRPVAPAQARPRALAPVAT
ncbi:MAG: hypothetical protein E7774_13715 [Bradyrhizobium sp.]|nr:MAG: hypothetical protein E7774_13715 [Bradyrhizobium sp.]